MIFLERLKNNENGLDVHVREITTKTVLKNIHPGAVKILLGQEDMDYMLCSRLDESFIKLTPSDIDFLKRCEVK